MKRWLSDNGHDLLFWGVATLAVGNVVMALNGPLAMRDTYLITSMVCAGAAALLYLSEPVDDE